MVIYSRRTWACPDAQVRSAAEKLWRVAVCSQFPVPVNLLTYKGPPLPGMSPARRILERGDDDVLLVPAHLPTRHKAQSGWAYTFRRSRPYCFLAHTNEYRRGFCAATNRINIHLMWD
jgi:hypothetical protein